MIDNWWGVVIVIVINAAVVGVGFGKLWQTVEDIKRRIGLTEDSQISNNVKREKWQDRMEDKPHDILPVCMKEFKDINQKLNKQSGTIDAIFKFLKDGNDN